MSTVLIMLLLRIVKLLIAVFVSTCRDALGGEGLLEQVELVR